MKVEKRSGKIVEFENSKIVKAVKKAFGAVEINIQDEKINELLAFINTKNDGEIKKVEDIQDSIVKWLHINGYHSVGIAFTKYRERRAIARDTSFNSVNLVNEYLCQLDDMAVHENSSTMYSLQGLNNHLFSSVSEKYWLSLYSDEIKKAYNSGRLHIHDLQSIAAYCSGWDLKSLLLEGFGGVAGKPSSKPPKHLSSALNQANNFIFTVQGEFAGAIAFSNFNTLLAPFVREDNLSYNQVKQEIQQFIYNLNISTRVGFQCLSEDTEILSENGWVGYNDLKVGDKILTFNMSSKQFEYKFEYKETQNVFKEQYEGKMVHISDGLFGYVDHLVTPNHRVVVYDKKNDEYVFENAENIKQCENDIYIPLPIPAISDPTYDDMKGVGFVNIPKDDIRFVDYSGIVWCPTTENGTVIARRNGKCFITGNSPFSNLTLDLDSSKVKFADEPCIVGGEMKEYSYGDCNKEATWINQAVVEVLSEGDADGAMLSYPIVTFNVTKDFPWQNKLGKTVLDATSKYGSFYFCLDENHIVYTETGRKMLKDVTVTDKILDNNNNYIGILNIIRNKKDEYLKITTKDNKTIKSSLNHRFPVLNTENNLKYVIKKAEELSISDKLMRNMYEIQLENGLIIDSDNIHLFEVCDNNGNEIQLKEFENVTDFVSIKRKRDLIKIKDISDFLFIPERHKTAIKMLTKIPSNINSDIYELLGELLGDGYVKQKDGHITLTNADTEILDFFSEKIKELFDYNVTIGKAGKSLKAKTVHLHSVHIKEFLKYCGLEMANYKHKNIPSQMFTETDNHIGALLRGIFDTDGSIGLSNGGSAIIKLVMKNEKIIKDIQVLLALLNINSSRKHRESDYCPTLYITGYNNILNFYKKVGFRIIRKQEILKKYCKTAIETKQLNRPYVGCKIISKDEIKNPEYEKYFYKKYEENDRKYFRILETDDEKLYYFVNSVVVKNNVSLDIIKIEHVYENINLIDITVNNKEHLFMIDGGVITHNSNYINSDYSESDILSMCCRLSINKKDIQKHLGEYTGGLSQTEYEKTHQKGHGFFGAEANTGSIGVVTLNIPAIMYDAKEKGGDWDEFLTLVKYYMDLAIEVLMKKRKVVEEYMEKGLYPYARHYLREVKKRTGHYFTQHFSTICPNGIHEALYIYGFKDGIMCDDGLNKAIELLKFMNEYTVELQKEFKVLINLEQAPAESAGVKLCQKSGVDPFGNGYYTNSSWQPAESKIDLIDLIDMQGKLNVYYTGGSSMHTYTDSDLVPIANDLQKIIMYAFTETKIPYMTISPVFSVCHKCGRMAGKHHICPKCGSKKIEIYERIVGYYRPHTNWNKGRLKESEKRNYLKLDKKS